MHGDVGVRVSAEIDQPTNQAADSDNLATMAV